MTSGAATALVGVVVGAALGFSLTQIGAWLRRRRQGRTAARLIWFELMSARKKLRKLTIRELGPPDDDLSFSTHAWDTERGRFTEVADNLAFALVGLAYEEMDKLARDYSKLAKMAESHGTSLGALANDDAPFSPLAEGCRDEIERALVQLDRYNKLAKEPVDYAELDRRSGFPR